jgi:hypothetical protein
MVRGGPSDSVTSGFPIGELSEEGIDGASSVAAPSVDGLEWCAGVDAGLEERREPRPLAIDERGGRTAEAFGERELEEERAADVSEVVDGCVEPDVERSSAASGRAVDGSLGGGGAGFGPSGFDVAQVDEPVEGSVDGVARGMPDLTDRGVGSQLAGDVVAVPGPLCEEPECGPLGERQAVSTLHLAEDATIIRRSRAW